LCATYSSSINCGVPSVWLHLQLDVQQYLTLHCKYSAH
jgi:hypothetical protein